MGKVFIAGGGKMNVPSADVLAGSLAVGSIVKLMENNQPVDYLVVHQGLPGTMYDASCLGCWVLRKDIFDKKIWSSSNLNAYKDSTINLYLNNEFYNLLGAIEKSIVKQVKIPYATEGPYPGSYDGQQGLSCKIFLLSTGEVGWSSNDLYLIPSIGAKLDYFISGSSENANSKRIANYNGSPVYWWTRCPVTDNSKSVWVVNTSGHYGSTNSAGTEAIRPALILPSNALFDKETMQLKGIKGGM